MRSWSQVLFNMVYWFARVICSYFNICDCTFIMWDRENGEIDMDKVGWGRKKISHLSVGNSFLWKWYAFPPSDVTNKRSDITTFRGALESVMRQHYPQMVGHVAIRLVSAPAVCSDSLNILSRWVRLYYVKEGNVLSCQL